MCGGDGNRASYDSARASNLDATFQRLCPRSDAASALETDNLDFERMVEAVRYESLTDPAYFGDVFMAALVVACRKLGPSHAGTLFKWKAFSLFKAYKTLRHPSETSFQS